MENDYPNEHPCRLCPAFKPTSGNHDCIKTCSLPEEFCRKLGGMTHSVPEHMTTYGRKTTPALRRINTATMFSASMA